MFRHSVEVVVSSKRVSIRYIKEQQKVNRQIRPDKYKVITVKLNFSLIISESQLQ